MVGGPQVADGYFGREDLTKERFINLKDGSRVYRTGDRGRILANGLVECLGRTEKGQVKVNGQRVELDGKPPQCADSYTCAILSLTQSPNSRRDLPHL